MDQPEISDPSRISFGLARLRMRMDGFVSFDVGLYREGLLVTRPLLSEVDALELNAPLPHRRLSQSRGGQPGRQSAAWAAARRV